MSHLEDTNLGSNSSNVSEQPGIAEVSEAGRTGRLGQGFQESKNIQTPTTSRTAPTNRPGIAGDELSSGKLNNNRSRNNTGRSEQEIQELLVMRTHSAPPGESGDDRQQKKFQPFKSKAGIDSPGPRRGENSPSLSTSSSVPATPPTAALPSPVTVPTSATASPAAAPLPTPPTTTPATSATTSSITPAAASTTTPATKTQAAPQASGGSKDSPKPSPHASPGYHNQPPPPQYHQHGQHHQSPRFNNGRGKNSPYADPYQYRNKGMPSPQQQRYDLPPPQMGIPSQLPPTMMYPVQGQPMMQMQMQQGFPANGNFPPGAIPISMIPPGGVSYPGQPQLYFVPGQPQMMAARPLYPPPQQHIVYEQPGLRGHMHVPHDILTHSPQQRMQGNYKQSPGRGSPNARPLYPRGSPDVHGYNPEVQHGHHMYQHNQALPHQHQGSQYAPRPPMPPQQLHKSSPVQQQTKTVAVDQNKKKFCFKDKSGNVLNFDKSSTGESSDAVAGASKDVSTPEDKFVDLSKLKVVEKDESREGSVSEISMAVNVDETENKDDGELRSFSQMSTASIESDAPKMHGMSPATRSVASSMDINSVDAVIGGDDQSDADFMRSEASSIANCSPLPPPAIISASADESTSDSTMSPPPYDMEPTQHSDNDSPPTLKGESIASPILDHHDGELQDAPKTTYVAPRGPVSDSPNTKPSASEGTADAYRSKKSIRKEKLAAADHNIGGSMLDAYTTPTEPPPAPVQASVPVARPAPPPAEPETAAEAEVENDWEAQAAKVMEEGLPIKPARSLRPGGGMGKPKLNVGPKPSSPVFRQTYTKEEILRLRPPAGTQFERPASVPVYSPIVYVLNDGTIASPSQRMPLQGGPPRPSYQDSPKQQWKTPYQQMGPQGDPGWQRGYHAPPKRQRGPAPPMPKRVIENPMEIVSRDAQEILNKIAPQTFEKLTDKFGEIPIVDYQTLDLIARLIFDKATAEPNYAHLYVEMCIRLDGRQILPSYCTICELPETSQYRWVREVPFSPVAGPFNNPDEAVAAALALANLSPSPVRLHSVQVLGIGETMIHLMKGDNELFYVFYANFADLPGATSSNLYSTFEAAKRSCCKKHSLARLLVEKCQNEYVNSTEMTGKHGEYEPMVQKLNADAPNLTEEEFLQRKADIEEFRGFLKRRLLGNIRLIGELFKQCNTIRTFTMHQCLQDVLMKKNQRVDEQEMEVVCKLLMAIGSSLEAKSSPDERLKIDLYFQKLKEFSTDRSFTSRMRFQINDVLDLRRNNWKERRAVEKPTLVEDLRQKAGQEQQTKRTSPMQIASGFTSSKKQQGRASHPDPRYQLQQRQDPRVNRAEGAPIHRHQSSGPGAGRGNYDGQDLRRIQSESKHDRNRSGSSTGSEVFSHVREVEEMPLELVRKRVKGLVEEYLMTRSDSEAVACMTELPSTASGELVCVLIDKLLDSRKDEVHNLLLQLLDILMPSLQSGPVFVEGALRTCEPLLCLPDFTMDNHHAPEIIGNILNRIVISRACNRTSVVEILDAARKANKDDEYGVPDEELAKLHSRLMAVVR